MKLSASIDKIVKNTDDILNLFRKIISYNSNSLMEKKKTTQKIKKILYIEILEQILFLIEKYYKQFLNQE